MFIRQAVSADAEAIASVRVRSWQTTYRGIIPDSYLDSMQTTDRIEFLIQMFIDPDNPAFCYVAEQPRGKLVAFASAGPVRGNENVYQGELYAIYLLKEAQRKGLGANLFKHVARKLLDDGLESMIVWVLEKNRGGRAFYEAMGGHLCSRKQIEIGGTSLWEVSYGWMNIYETFAHDIEDLLTKQ